MDHLFVFFLIVFGILILVILFQNIYTLKKVIRNTQSDEELKLSDKRYYELYYKNQLIIILASIIIPLLAFLGYNSIDSVKEDIGGLIKKDITKYVDNLEEYDSILNIQEMMLETYDASLQESEELTDTLRNSLVTYKIELGKVKNQMSNLQNEYRLNAKTYLIKNVEIDSRTRENTIIQVIPFSELRKLNPKVPMKFKVPPFISLSLNGDGTIYVIDRTTEQFKISYSGTVEMDSTVLKEILAGKSKRHPSRVSDAYSFDAIIVEDHD